jgi:hypothetical protein
MIIGTVTVSRSMILAALAAVSFLLAIVSFAAALNFGIPTPGFTAASILYFLGQPSFHPHGIVSAARSGLGILVCAHVYGLFFDGEAQVI